MICPGRIQIGDALPCGFFDDWLLAVAVLEKAKAVPLSPPLATSSWLLTANLWHAVHDVPLSPAATDVEMLQLRFVLKSRPTYFSGVFKLL